MFEEKLLPNNNSPSAVMRSFSLSVELDGSLVSKYRCPPTLLPPLAYAATLALVVLPVLLQKSIVPIAVPSDTDAFLDNLKTASPPLFVLRIVPPLYVNVASPSNVFAVPEPVIIRLSALLFIVVPVIPVKLEPSPYKVSAYKFLHLVPVNPKSCVLSVPGAKCPVPEKYANVLLSIAAVLPELPLPRDIFNPVSYTHLTLPTKA